MVCNRCKHQLSREEINVNLCWECGAIIDSELVSDNIEEAKKVIENIENEQRKQDKKEKLEAKEKAESEHSEYSVISTIHTYFNVISIFAMIGSIVIGIDVENLFVFLVLIISISLTYCVFRVLIAIAYLLCDIKENTTSRKKCK